MSGARYVFVLGAPNLDDGTLSPISIGRVDAAEQLFRSDPTVRIIATGGHGAHFNRAQRPHRAFVEDELSLRGLPVTFVTAGELLSANTVEDALMIGRLAKRLELRSFEVVTSLFHVPRCCFVFDCLCSAYQVTICASCEPTDVDEALLAHETKALAILVEQGGVMVDGRLHISQQQ